jgi:hypothetical protein
MEASVITKIIEASPYLGFILLFMWFEAKREDKRTANAEELETRREKHEKELEEKREAHDRDINNMWASYIKSILDQQNEMSKALMDTIVEHEESSQQRYERLGITQELINAVKESQRLRAEGKIK